jgi:hypothetical protein
MQMHFALLLKRRARLQQLKNSDLLPQIITSTIRPHIDSVDYYSSAPSALLKPINGETREAGIRFASSSALVYRAAISVCFPTLLRWRVPYFSAQNKCFWSKAHTIQTTFLYHTES